MNEPEPTQAEIDRVTAWQDNKRIAQCSRDLENLVDDGNVMTYMGEPVTVESCFTKKALIGMVLKAMKQTFYLNRIDYDHCPFCGKEEKK